MCRTSGSKIKLVVKVEYCGKKFSKTWAKIEYAVATMSVLEKSNNVNEDKRNKNVNLKNAQIYTYRFFFNSLSSKFKQNASNSSRVSTGLHKISASSEAVAQSRAFYGSFSYFQSRFP